MQQLVWKRKDTEKSKQTTQTKIPFVYIEQTKENIEKKMKWKSTTSISYIKNKQNEKNKFFLFIFKCVKTGFVLCVHKLLT